MQQISSIIGTSTIYPNWDFWFEKIPSGNPESGIEWSWQLSGPFALPDQISSVINITKRLPCINYRLRYLKPISRYFLQLRQTFGEEVEKNLGTNFFYFFGF
jgi:hypothetical protein